MKVDMLMSRDVKTCAPTATLDDAARIMWENDCGCVPVVDEQGRATAMVTDRDICMAGLTQGRPYSQIPVSVAASKALYAVKSGDTAQSAEALMSSRQVRRLAVIDDSGRLVGLLSLNDLARRAGRRTGEVASDEVARTLSSICERPSRTTGGMQSRLS